MSGVRATRVVKRLRAHRMKSRSVLRMMAIMQDRNSQEVPREFLETGRTGRRNAMPDILHPQGAEVSTADLPSRLQKLVTSDLSPSIASISGRKSDLSPSIASISGRKSDTTISSQPSTTSKTESDTTTEDEISEKESRS